MPEQSDDKEIFEPFEFVPQPTAACGFVQPQEIVTNQFVSDKSRDFQLSHVATCSFCQQKVERFRATQTN